MRSRRFLRLQFWLETGLAVGAGLLAPLTLITRDWIEVVFGLDPDGGSGAVEWAIVAALAVAAVVLALLGRRSWTRISSIA